MRHYEVMVILDPDLEERQIAPSVENFLNVIRTNGGTVEKTVTEDPSDNCNAKFDVTLSVR